MVQSSRDWGRYALRLGRLNQTEHASHISRRERSAGINPRTPLGTEQAHKGSRWGTLCDVKQKPVDDGLANALPLVFGKDGYVLDIEVNHSVTDKAAHTNHTFAVDCNDA